ncbi:DUF262 domain-containing protein [Rothia sp. HMSC069C04]|jgi:hypothetical protein APCC8_06789|uniref:DUF262 domain-containing protein n=1 Tax=Rothia sp. HMSC069C04 TaxID=1739383 RepID=UPI0008A2B07B|nr:DUF262 domain-containing protein [Rothia sp. HMSC069C04]OFR64991.1 hypothetical protein HMPREF2879_06500 [Rothia sp. HMSC069C04]
MSNLEEEITKARRKIHTDSYPMSIGELVNLYEDGELVISPNYQRIFRWRLYQKSQFIESIFIGIPIPSIFVATDSEGRWEVVDGLQRISTLLEFMGVLRDAESVDNSESFHKASVLGKTEYLPSLEGVAWSNDIKTKGTPTSYLTPAQQRRIKRAKLDLKIVGQESDVETKYDLFMRINSNGSNLSNQEIRGAALAGISSDFIKWLSRRAKDDNFVNLLNLTDTLIGQKYDEELVLRFLMLSQMSDSEILNTSDFTKALDSFSREFAMDFESKKERYEMVFKEAFEKLSAFPDIFHPWEYKNSRYKGRFTLSAFEVFAAGIGFCIFNGINYCDNFEELSKEFWNSPGASKTTGISTETRIRRTVLLGREMLKIAVD